MVISVHDAPCNVFSPSAHAQLHPHCFLWYGPARGRSQFASDAAAAVSLSSSTGTPSPARFCNSPVPSGFRWRQSIAYSETRCARGSLA